MVHCKRFVSNQQLEDDEKCNENSMNLKVCIQTAWMRLKGERRSDRYVAKDVLGNRSGNTVRRKEQEQ